MNLSLSLNRITENDLILFFNIEFVCHEIFIVISSRNSQKDYLRMKQLNMTGLSVLDYTICYSILDFLKAFIIGLTFFLVGSMFYWFSFKLLLNSILLVGSSFCYYFLSQYQFRSYFQTNSNSKQSSSINCIIKKTFTAMIILLLYNYAPFSPYRKYLVFFNSYVIFIESLKATLLPKTDRLIDNFTE